MIHIKVFTEFPWLTFISCFISKLCIYLVVMSLQGQGFLPVLFTVSPVSRRESGPSRSLRSICRLCELNPWLLHLVGAGVLDMTD